MPEFLLTLHPEGDVELRGIQSELPEIRRIVVDHTVDLERRETRDRVGQLSLVGRSLLWLHELPCAIRLFGAGTLARRRLDLNLLDLISVDGKRLRFDLRCAGRRLLRIDEVDVSDEPNQDDRER